MKYKKSLVFICLLICLFTIGSVVATDANETSVASGDQEDFLHMENSLTNDYIQHQNENEEDISAVSENSFDSLSNRIKTSKEVKLTSNYAYNEEVDKHLLYTGIKINNAVSIDGQNHYIDGKNKICAFYVKYDNVTLKNIRFVNCGYSAVMWNGASGSIINCSFINCSAGTYGGAVIWDGTCGNIINSTFINCSCTKYESYGGAIRWEGTNGHIINSTFINNTAGKGNNIYIANGVFYQEELISNNQINEGVYTSTSFKILTTLDKICVHVPGVKNGKLQVIFSNNTTIIVDIIDGIAKLNLIEGHYNLNITFIKENYSSISVYNEYIIGKELWKNSFNEIYDNQIIEITQDYMIGQYSYIHDFIAINGDNIIVNGNGHTINVNQYGLFDINGNNITLKNFNFINVYRDAINWYGNNGSLINCSFCNSSADSNGLISWFGSNGFISNIQFINNTCTSTSPILYFKGNNMNCFNASFKNNTGKLIDSYSTNSILYNISSNDGSLYICGNNGLIKNCEFNSTLVSFSGINSSMEYCNFFNGISKTNDISVLSTGSNVTIKNCLFSGCRGTASRGGAISLGKYSYIINCTIINCNANSGSAIYCRDHNTTIIDTIIENCSSKYGTIYNLVYDNLKIINCSFIGNSANYGGAVLVEPYYEGNFFIFNSTFINNFSNTTLIQSTGNNSFISNSKLINNTCLDLIKGLDENNIFNCIFEDNSVIIKITTKEFYLNGTLSIQSIPGSVEIFVNGSHLSGNIENYKIDFIIPKNISSGTQKLTIIHNGNDLFKTTIVEKIIDIKKIVNYDIGIKNTSLSIGEKIDIILPNDAKGIINISIDNQTFLGEVQSGHAYIDISKLKSGLFNAKLYYTGDSCYSNKTIESKIIRVYKLNTDLLINITNNNVNKNITFTMELLNDATGNISLSLNNHNYIYNNIHGSFTIVTKKLPQGNYTAKIVYSGNDYYKPLSYTLTFEVFGRIILTKNDILINLNLDKENIGQLTIQIPNNATGILLVDINNQNYYGNLINGIVNILVPNLVDKNYALSIKYLGDDNYDEFFIQDTLEVFKTIKSNDMNINYNSALDFQATFYDNEGNALSNKYVIFKVDGTDYPVITSFNGVATLKVGLMPGTYEITLINTVTDEVKTNTLIINSKPIDEKDIVIPTLPSSSSGSVTVKLPSDATGTVTLNIGGKEHTFNVVNGVANVKMPDLANGAYSYSIIYSGDGKYSSFTKTGKVTINKPVKTTLTLKKVKVKRSAKKLVIQATLKINGKAVKGKTIKFKFNKKTYKAKTNKKGVAKITIKKKVLKKLKKGKKVTYTATYGKLTKKVTVKVKK